MRLVGPITQLLPMDRLPLCGPVADEALPIISHAGILIDGEKIAAIGPFDALRDRAVDTIDISFPSVALPGFIDAHTHCCFAGSRASEYALRMGGPLTKRSPLKEGEFWRRFAQHVQHRRRN